MKYLAKGDRQSVLCKTDAPIQTGKFDYDSTDFGKYNREHGITDHC